MKKQKIGVLTFHRAINYGALLQVYALQEKLIELGADTSILDYRNEKLENHHKEMKLTESKGIKGLILYFLLNKNYNTKYRKFRDFSEKYLNLTKPILNHQELNKVDQSFDKFITGSDQVWNYKISNLDPAYFLNFTKEAIKRNSYAASLGVNVIPDDKKDRYKNLLKDFNNILVREHQGAQIVNDLLGKEVDVVIDPTLLIKKEKWLEIAKMPSVDRYILIYAFGGSKNIMEFAEKLSKLTGYRILAISGTLKKNKNVTYVKNAGPKEFLGLFNKAEYIITNSFHGTVFSINLNKQFFTELLPNKVGTNSRMEDVLALFNLKERQILDSEVDNYIAPIDYEKVNNILESEREKSVALLRAILK